ncbi:MAG: hypothetical protein H0V12_10820 [Chloroflexi bacterium]|nr:hypothetical protein [Chloroflexota bacterium]
MNLHRHLSLTVAAVVLSLVPAAQVAAGEAAGPPRSTPTGGPPACAAAPPRARPLTDVDKGLRRQVYAFLNGYQIDYARDNLDYSVLSDVAYFSVNVERDGRLRRCNQNGTTNRRWALWAGAGMTEIINEAHAAGTRIVLTVTQFAWTPAGAEDMVALLSDRTARLRLAEQIARAVVERGVDGVNIDFEPIPASQKTNFVRLVRAVRRALDARDPSYGLTYAATGHIANYDVAALTGPGAADAVFIMGYHYRGSWSRRAGSIAPLSGPNYDVSDTVERFLARTTADRIILGVPYYGFMWSTTGPEVRSTVQSSVADYGSSRSVTYQSAIALARQHGRLWDPVEQSPWTRFRYRACSTCPETWRQMYYDDARSLGLKYDLVNRRDLLGAGIWALGYEGPGGQLDEVLRRKFVE